MKQHQMERIQGWSAKLQAMADEVAELQAELIESSGVSRSTIDKLGATFELVDDARTLLAGISGVVGGSTPVSSGREEWAAAIRSSIAKGYGDPSGEVPA